MTHHVNRTQCLDTMSDFRHTVRVDHEAGGRGMPEDNATISGHGRTDVQWPQPDALDAAWLGRRLSALVDDEVRVTGLRVEPVGSGMMAQTHRLTVDYAGPRRAERSYILKSTGAGAVSRRTGRRGFGFPGREGFYAREVRFFRDIAPHAAIRVPVVQDSWISAEGDEFALLMEDIHPARPGDELVGCSHAEAQSIMRNLAGLHAPFWGFGDELDAAWAVPTRSEGEAYSRMTAGNVEATLRAFRGELESEDVAVLEAFAERSAVWFVGDGRPHTITHNDFRLDNILFPSSGGDATSVVVDWQTVMGAAAGRDVGQFLAGSLPDELWAGRRDDLLGDYRRRLAELGVDGHSAEDAREDLRWGTLQALHNVVVTARAVDMNERTKRMLTMWLRRVVTRAREIDATSVVRVSF